MAIFRVSILLFMVVVLGWPAKSLKAEHAWQPPVRVPPHEYGNVLINRGVGKSGMGPVWFSHWSHRTRYSCRVCHLELGFAFKQNQTEIREEDNKRGLFCGACHNGQQAFGHKERESCGKCHGNSPPSKEKFNSLLKNFSRTPYGNQVDWVKAVSSSLIKPLYSINSAESKPLPFDEDLVLKATPSAPAVYFPHDKHLQWLDCAACHPALFNIKKKAMNKKNTIRQMRMDLLLNARFCGVCHLNVAFPINNCIRCHKKGIEGQPDED